MACTVTAGHMVAAMLKDRGMTQEAFARHIGVSRYSVNQLVNGRRSITADMAIRLSAALGMHAETWLQMQIRADLFAARRRKMKRISYIKAQVEHG